MKSIVVSLVLTAAIGLSFAIGEYPDLWKEVTEQEKASLPESALEKVELVHAKAMKEKNSAQLIKAMIYRLKYQAEKDQDSIPERLKEIETLAASTTDTVEQSMLYGLLAQLYWKYYQSNQHKFDAMTPIAGDFVPEDIREWSGNLFVRKSIDYVALSMKHAKVLQETDVQLYKDILLQDSTTRSPYATIYDFLASEGISLLKQLQFPARKYYEQSELNDGAYFAEKKLFCEQVIQAEPYDIKKAITARYRQWLSSKSLTGNREALLLTDLERLQYVYNESTYEWKEVDYIEALSRLEEEYANNPFCVEVLYRKAQYYSQVSAPIVPLKDKTSGKITILTSDDSKQLHNEILKLALEACDKGIRLFPEYGRIGILKNLRHSLTDSYVNLEYDKQVYPQRSLSLKTKYRNVRDLTVEIYRIHEPVTAYENTWQENGLYKHKNSELVGKQSFTLPSKAEYLEADTLLEIPMKEAGLYEFVAYANGDKTEGKLINGSFSVSSIYVAARRIDSGLELLVTDFISGKPTGKFHAVFYKQNKATYTEVKKETDGKNGSILVPVTKDMQYYQVYTDDPKDASRLASIPYYYEQHFNEGATTQSIQLFTDRSIYRPGQSVHFKGIISYSPHAGSGRKVVAHQKVEVLLRDANHEIISNKTLTSNDFGSFSGEFTLPTGGLNGSYSLSIEQTGSYLPIQVEEYKRPSFEISFDSLNATYSFGDQVKISGNIKTFSGIRLADTQLTYRITRNPHGLWRFGPYSTEQISYGTLTSDAQGAFELSFSPEKAFSDRKRKEVYYTYLIEATASSASGETQTSSNLVCVGDKSMLLSMDNLTKLDKEHPTPINISATTLNQVPVHREGSFKLYRLKDTASLAETIIEYPHDYKKEPVVASGQFSTKEALSLDMLKKEASGRYMLLLTSTDDKGREISSEQAFILYSASDKRPPVTTYFWLPETIITGEIGKNASIYLGSSAPAVEVLQDIFVKGKKTDSKRFSLNKNIKKIDLPFTAEYSEGVDVLFTFIKDGNLFSEKVAIKPKKEERKLLIKTEVFRDRLVPGQQEEWKLSVKDEQLQPVKAEVLAAMYDASLDKLHPHQWYFQKEYNTWDSGTSGFNTATDRLNYLYIRHHSDYIQAPAFSFDRFNWFGLYFNGGNRMQLRAMAMGSGVKAARPQEEAMAANQSFDAGFTPELMTKVMEPNPPMPGAEAQVRSNLNETAFFYPQLKTNEAGETLISFTLPESNTTWKFMALAHTTDMLSAELIKEAVSQKSLMVTPNMPRFMRQGDEMEISTLVSNLSETQQTGEVAIFFFDPGNEAPLFIAKEQTKYFKLAPGESRAVAWRFIVPEGIDMAGCKIIAQSESFSDGEQHLLPIVSNKILLTESLPLAISGKGNKKFVFDRLKDKPSATATNYRLSLEFTGNPAWYAVQALPTMSTPSNENAVSWSAAYYANSMATRIAQLPGIKQTIETWKKQAGETQTLWSNLEKNSELKAVLLEETPWVLEARNETEQKQALHLLFDDNRNRNLRNTAITQLSRLQKEDGGWPWIEGMRSNTSITQWIAYGLGRLARSQAGTTDNKINEMSQQAIGFIDYRFKRSFDAYKKETKDRQALKTLTTYQLEYLYVRSFYPEIPVSETREASDFYLNILEKHWAKDTNLYHRALAAVILNRAGKEAVAQSILRSLKQHATQHPEMGMYWPNNTTSAFFFQSAVAVHTFMMEAFEELGVDNKKDLDNMKLWLLKQKQTQQWESTPATVNAVYALLNVNTGSNWLASGKEDIRISIGNEQLDLSASEAGTAYIKKVYEAGEIKPETMNTVELSKTGEGPAWGALYLQYFEDIDKVTKSKTALHIEKKLFVERIASTGRTLEEVKGESPLKVGDKLVVRLTVRSDRDMEFVMLKDTHSAGIEPAEQLSGIKWNAAVPYYQATKDASTRFYFDGLPKGTYVFEYALLAGRAGNYSNGPATIQCMYAPEFVSHSEGGKLEILNK